MLHKNKKGFTLIELLVVVAIIGILASVVLASLNEARMKGRDARRMSDLKQIQNALELYFNDNGRYPQRDQAQTNTNACGGNASWCSLVTDLTPYISSIPGDPLGLQVNYIYYYDSDSGDNYQTYGLITRFESSSNFNKAANDGGFFGSPYYEVGQQPTYCVGKYLGADRDWYWGTAVVTVCAGGN